MAYNGLIEFVEVLKAHKLIEEVDNEINPCLEAAEVADRFFYDANHEASSHEFAKALLFENDKFEMPLLMNIFGSPFLLELAMSRQSPEMLVEKISKLLALMKPDAKGKISKYKLGKEALKLTRIFPKRSKNIKAPCFDVVMDVPDITKLPVIQSWPGDAGSFITLPLVHTVDPETGEQNMGMYRMQIFDSQTTGMHWHKHKGGAAHFDKYKKLNRRMPVTVTLGGDPALIYAATAPLPPGVSEFLLAGFIRNERIDLVQCHTNAIFIPKISDVVIEGYIDPNEDGNLEGPFGDHTGFYSPVDIYPVFHITSISYRRDAVFPATIVGIPPKEDLYLGKLTESLFFPLIQQSLFEPLTQLYLPAEGGFHNLAVAAIRNDYPSQAYQLMHAFWGAGQMAFTKFVAVCDSDVEIDQWQELLALLNAHFIPSEDLLLSKGIADVLDHASVHFLSGGKAGFDLCRKGTREILPQDIYIEILSSLNCSLLTPRIVVVYHDSFNEVMAQIKVNLSKLFADSGNGIVMVLPTECEKWSWTLQIWIALANMDPLRDFLIIRESNPGGILLMNGGVEDKKPVPGGQWPEKVLMDASTIGKIDDWWKTRFNRFVPSPSLRFK